MDSGIDLSDFASDKWWDGTLLGERQAKLKIARDKERGLLQVWIELAEQDERVVQLLAAVCQRFELLTRPAAWDNG
jgi:hypothetical protein